MIKKIIYAFIGVLLGAVVYGTLLIDVPQPVNKIITTQKPKIEAVGVDTEEERIEVEEIMNINAYFEPEYDEDNNLIAHSSGFEYVYDKESNPIGLIGPRKMGVDAFIPEYDEFGQLKEHSSGHEYAYDEFNSPIGLIIPGANYYDPSYVKSFGQDVLFANTYHINEDDIRYFESIDLLNYGRDNPMWYWVRVIDEKEEAPLDEDGNPIIQEGFTVAYDTTTKDVAIIDISDIKQRIRSEGSLPVGESYYDVTSPFGPRKDPFTGNERFHVGLDIADVGIAGREVYSVLDGTIEHASSHKDLGNFIIVNHGYYNTIYAHLEAFSENLKIGMEVESGDAIGYVGTTGRSTGHHLHIEFDIDGVKVNPEIFMKILRGEEVIENNETDLNDEKKEIEINQEQIEEEKGGVE